MAGTALMGISRETTKRWWESKQMPTTEQSNMYNGIDKVWTSTCTNRRSDFCKLWL